LADMPTGPRLGALLAPVEAAAVPDEQLLELLSAQWRQLAYQQARVWAVMAELATRNPMLGVPDGPVWSPDQVFDSAVDEVRAELRLTRRAAQRELEHADAVCALPPVAAALEAGLIDRAKAIVLADGCADLTGEQAARLLAEVLPAAGRVTATGLAERVRRVAIALDPEWAERRYRQALSERRVIGYLNEDGSATVSGQHLPADQAAAALARVNALADAAKRAGAAGRIDHLRAELFLGLLDGQFETMTAAQIVEDIVARFAATQRETEPAVRRTGRGTGVELRVGLGTLLGLDDQPGEVAGWGPVPASVARDLAATQRRSEWRFAIVDEQGRLSFDGTTRHRPTGPRNGPAEKRGGIVELQVPLSLLGDAALAREHPAWAGLGC